MNKIKEAIEAAWQRSHGEKEYDPGYPIKASSNFAEGYNAGAADALSHQWISVAEELPSTDGDYLTLIKQEESFYIEIAPWRKGEYQGSQIMAVNFGQHKVTHWMPIPIPPIFQEI